jgi:5-methylcytosine-specific restriction endonuclease McrA
MGCPLMANAAPIGCDWCGRGLTKRQKRWCSKHCNAQWSGNHVWSAAREAALRRDGNRCVRCGCKNDLEVNHKTPRRGRGYDTGCWNHLDNLESLCRKCHQKTTNAQKFRRWRIKNRQRPWRTPDGGV